MIWTKRHKLFKQAKTSILCENMKMKHKSAICVVLLLILAFTSLQATQYANISSQYTFSIDTQYSSIQLMASDKSGMSSGYLLENDNGVYKIDLGKWAKGASKVYTAAFAIVNTEKNVYLRITEIEVTGGGEHLTIALHKHRDLHASGILNVESENEGDYMIYYSGGTSIPHSDDGFVLYKGNGYQSDYLRYTRDSVTWRSATYDSELNVWVVNENLVDADTLTNDADTLSNFVWVEVCLSNLDKSGDYSGSIIIHAKSLSAAEISLLSPSWTKIGEGGDFGYSIASGDVNGDGLKDVVVGAWGCEGRGKVFLFLGESEERSLYRLSETPAWEVSGGEDWERFGWSVACADLNNDGYDDIIVGSSYYREGGEPPHWYLGRVQVYYGSSWGPSWGWERDGDGSIAWGVDNFGYSLATGDINGDGIDDLVVGEPYYGETEGVKGKVSLFLGNENGLDWDPIWTAIGGSYDSCFGISVACANVNNDDYDDVIIGAKNWDSNKGKAYMYLGGNYDGIPLPGEASWSVSGESAGDYFGNSVACAGDVNSDGYEDVIIGAYGFSSAKGKVYLYAGNSGGLSGTAVWTASGDSLNDWFGYSVSSAGDVNGDGLKDVLIGAYGYSSFQGQVKLYLGNEGSYLQPTAWSKSGEETDDYYGLAITPLGDIDGDNYDDIMIGAPNYDWGKGKVYKYAGNGYGLAEDADWTASWSSIGEENGMKSEFGYSVLLADVNGDGFDDAIIGAPKYDLERGKVYVVLGMPDIKLAGKPSWVAIGEVEGSQFGYSIAIANVNNDEFDDIIIGAPNYRDGDWATQKIGKAYLYLGSGTGLSTEPAWTKVGDTSDPNDHYFGYSVACAGDVNNDGYDDVIVGEPGYSDAEYTQRGRASLFLGSSSGLYTDASWQALGEDTDHRFGVYVASAGDVNCDNRDDVMISAMCGIGAPYQTGKVYVYHGSSSSPYLSTVADWSKSGDTENMQFGLAMSCAGDVNNDGYDDIIIGAPAYDDVYDEDVGKVYLYFGSASGVSGDPAWTETGLGSYLLGYPVVGAGDLNSDGYDDVIIGAPGYMALTGKVIIYYGSTTGLTVAPIRMIGEMIWSVFGVSISVGDVDNDGNIEVLVGAPGYPSNTGKVYLYTIP